MAAIDTRAVRAWEATVAAEPLQTDMRDVAWQDEGFYSCVAGNTLGETIRYSRRWNPGSEELTYLLFAALPP